MRNERDFPRAKAFLERLRTAQKRVKTLEERIACIGMMLGAQTTELTDVKVCASPDPHKNERLMAMRVDLEREKEEAEAEARRIREDAEVMIGKISNPDAQKVLIHHYLDGLNWSETAAKVGYSRIQVYRLMNQGYDGIEAMLEAN